MTVANTKELHDLLVDAEALKEAMDVTLAGKTEDHAKWVSFRNFAQTHANLAARYHALTGENSPYYDASKMKGSMDTLWPIQKQYFEGVYSELKMMLARLTKRLPQGSPTGFDDLLHPKIREAAIKHYQLGDYRNAALDAIVALFDLLRAKTGLDMDGDNLCNQAFSPSNPILILSDLDTESGRNDQRGFMDIFKGFYRGVRNPKAHSLTHDLDAIKAGQHLVLASLLARRVDEATVASEK